MNKYKLKRLGKSVLLVAVLVFLTFTLVDCDRKEDPNVKKVLKEKTEETSIAEKETKSFEKDIEINSEDTKSLSGVDYDLTTMNATMVYATVDNMMRYPEVYEGKTVKMAGQYYAAFDETDQKYYMFCLVSDALGCCSQGMEFVWGDGSHVYPDEYPTEKTEVVIEGTFHTYPSGNNTYCHISDASMTVK